MPGHGEDRTQTHGYEATKAAALEAFARWNRELKRARGYLNPPIRRRALVLLSSCPNGCTKAVLAAHDISDEIVRRLVRTGLAVARSEAPDEDGLEVGRVCGSQKPGSEVLSTRGRT